MKQPNTAIYHEPNVLSFLKKFYKQYQLVICANMLEPWEKRFVHCLFTIVTLIFVLIFYQLCHYVMAGLAELRGCGDMCTTISQFVSLERLTLSNDVFTTSKVS